MPSERRDLLVGRRAVERGWIPEAALAAAVARQERDIAEGLTARPIGALLVAAGALTPDQIAALIDEQSHALVLEEDALLGAILVRNALAAPDAVERALADQRAGAAPGRLGELLLERGAIDAQGLRAALAAQGRLAGRQATRGGVDAGETRQGAFVTQVPEALGAAVEPDLTRFGLTQADLDEARRLHEAGAGALGRTLSQADSDRFDALRGKPLGEILVALGRMAAASAADLDAALAASASGAPRGPRRFGRYELRAELGHGGMGKVYRAWDPDLKREVALKVLLLGDRADTDAIDRFQREARAAAGLSHPGIVPVYDVGAVDGKPYYTMELVQAEELTDLARAGGLTPRDAVEIARQVAEALRFSHARGILHRDIKPRNVFVARDGTSLTARVIDFGLAKFAEDEVRMDAGSKAGASLRTLTQTGQMLGTPLYMSPEQFEKAAEVDGRADVYSVGATLYELFTGAPPFADAATLPELIHKVQDVDPEPPRKRVPDLDLDAETICLKCLHKAPADRYAGAGDLADDCRRFLAGEEIAARPVGGMGRLWKRAKRNRGVATLVAGLALVLAVAAAWGGAEGINRWRLARFAEETDALLAAGRFAEAQAQADRALGLAPEDKVCQRRVDRAKAGLAAGEAKAARSAGNLDAAEAAARGAVQLAPAEKDYADLLEQVLSEKLAQAGDVALKQWRERVEQTAAQEKRKKDAEDAEEAAAPADRAAHKDARWQVTEDLRAGALDREKKWAEAVVSFSQATTHWGENPVATAALTELYWYRFLRAEQERDRTAEQAYAPLVAQFGGAEYAARIRCERPVRVRFELPPAFAAGTVVAYLYVYEPKKAPPILIPVPCDRVTGTPLDADDLLAKDLAFGRPVPLAAATAPPAASGSAPLLPAAELAERERQADAHVAAQRYAAALPLLDLLTRAAPAASGHAYNLACCLAVGARAPDPGAWLAAGADAAVLKELAQRAGADPQLGRVWGAALVAGADPSAWRILALAALEEAVRRGWGDAAHTAADADLAALRDDAGFAALLAALRGAAPARHVRVAEVVADSQAAKLGVRPGDVLVSIAAGATAGTPLETVAQASAAISAAPAGAAYSVTLQRGAERTTVAPSGGAPLGVRMVQADLRPESATRFPWLGEARATAPPAAPEVERARWSELHELRQRDGNRVELAVVRDGPGARPHADLALSLPRGSYLLHVPAGQDLYATRYPFEGARDLDWDERCELPAADDVPPPLPTAPRPPPSDAAAGTSGYWIYVPAGPYRASGDPKAQQSVERDAAILRVAQGKGLPMPAARKPGDLPSSAAPLPDGPPGPGTRAAAGGVGARLASRGLPAEGFFLARFEVTSGMYLEYLNDREWHKKVADAFARVPRQAPQASDATAHWKPDSATGRIGITTQGWREDWPLFAISWDDATDYCKWLTQQRGGGEWAFVLPEEDEWEKAARGPDGRFFPWGDDFDASFCSSGESRAGEQNPRNPEPFGLFPLDEGPYGVRDLSGGMQEWTGTKVGHGDVYRILKGGAWGSAASLCRAAPRNANVPRYVYGSRGLRLAARRTR